MELLIETQGSEEVNKHALFFLSNIDNLEKKIVNFEKINRKCDGIKQKTLDMYQSICACKQKTQKKVSSCFKLCYEMTKEVNQIESKKLGKYMKDIKKLELDFSYLLNPSQLPKAYEESLKEISRRRHFQQLLR